MSNFSFLQFEKDFVPFFAPAISAGQILHIDPAAYVLNYRRVMEFVVKWMHSVDKQLVTPYDDRLASQMKSTAEKIF